LAKRGRTDGKSAESAYRSSKISADGGYTGFWGLQPSQALRVAPSQIESEQQETGASRFYRNPKEPNISVSTVLL